MNLVSTALRRPFTVLALIVTLVLSAALSISRMPRDVFPDLGVPIIYVAQPYGGVDPTQMEGYITYYYEYHFLYITGIEHVESKSVQGNALIKLQFHPGTNMAQAMAETVSYVNRARAFMPAGTVPPFVTRFDAGSVPVGSLVFSSDTKTVAEIQDAALNKVRPMFATLPGVSAPPPFGGSARSIVIHADPDRLRSTGLSPDDVVGAIASANVISPSGNMRIGSSMPIVPTNAVVPTARELEEVAIRSAGAQSVFVRDIGTVEDSSDIVTGYALVNGRRTVYIPVTKRADASTLSVVSLVKQNLGKFQSALPDGVTVSYQFDQSGLVNGAINSLLTEGVLGALLTGLMVLAFLRDLRSAIIIVVNIPLALLASGLALALTGQTVNLMTLGGLALSVGILVDEATVTIENVHTHLARGKSAARAALDAGSETAAPRLLAMLCILAVFTPALFMTGAARSLFAPFSLAVGFSMAASYVLSSTLVPILTIWMLRSHKPRPHGASNVLSQFERLVMLTVSARLPLLVAYLAASAAVIGVSLRGIGTEIFPKVEAGQFQMRIKAPTGTRIERTEEIANRTLDIVKRVAGPDQIEISMGFVGVQAPSYPINTIHLWTGGPHEAVLQVQMKHSYAHSMEFLKEMVRRQAAAELPDVHISFEPSDIISRVMSFGSSTPVEVAVSGATLPVCQAYAEKIAAKMAQVPALRDIQFGQPLDYPTLQVTIDRQKAGMAGVTAQDIARSTVAATSSSRFTTPVYWADPKSGVAYQVQVDVPIAKMNSAEALQNTPLGSKSGSALLLRDVASVTPGLSPGEYDRYNSQRMITISANISGSDTGTISEQVKRAIADAGPPPPKAVVSVRGQIPAMEEILSGLKTGLVIASIVILLLLTASFQSPRLALVVAGSAPAVAAGVLATLRLSGTTLNLQSYMGAIMALGVAVANAILLVSFADRLRKTGLPASEAASKAAAGRVRPILMTSAAMIAGMLPTALGIGEGGSQSAPLGRAVIGGLAASTLSALFLLPALFTLLQNRAQRTSASLDPDDPDSSLYEANLLPAEATE
jgi:multidrug efflux pump subunit AcrB